MICLICAYRFVGTMVREVRTVFTLVTRLRSLSIGYDLRSRDLGSLMAMLTYSAIAWDPNTAVDQRMQRALVNMLAGETINTRRCLEVCLGLVSPIHRSSFHSRSFVA